MKKKIGKLVRNNTVFYGLEEDGVNFLLSCGFDIELIRPSNTKRNKNPDIWMLGKTWEVKTPISDNLTTIERKITKGGKQAENLILDLRFIRADEARSIKALTNRFKKSRRVKSLIIISKTRGLVVIDKK